MECWLLQRYKSFICYSSFVILVFRVELAVLLGLVLLVALFRGNLTFTTLFLTAVPVGIMSIGINSTLISLK